MHALTQPVDLSIGLVCEWLLHGQHYRQWAAVEADLEKSIEYTFGKSASKARDVLLEAREIVYFAQTGEDATEAPESAAEVSWSAFSSAVLDALEATAGADKEAFFADPVDTIEIVRPFL
jgi:hypothetical protein